MDVKLHVEIGDDRLDVEGEQSFVEHVFNEFKAKAIRGGDHLLDRLDDVAPLVAMTHDAAA